MKTKSIVVDLSIDFDFFSREDPLWDWGHNENWDKSDEELFWNLRYMHMDVYGETSIEKFADFMPNQLIEKLTYRGLDFSKVHRVGIADSHAQALPFFKKVARKAPDLLVQLDAHHDVYNLSNIVHCGNWLAHHLLRRPGRVLQLYPKWKAPTDDAPMHESTAEHIEVMQFENWMGIEGSPARVRNIFLCRSSSWVPPHQDAAFFNLAQGLATLDPWGGETLDFLNTRHCLSREDSDTARKNLADQFAQFSEAMANIHPLE